MWWASSRCKSQSNICWTVNILDFPQPLRGILSVYNKFFVFIKMAHYYYNNPYTQYSKCREYSEGVCNLHRDQCNWDSYARRCRTRRTSNDRDYYKRKSPRHKHKHSKKKSSPRTKLLKHLLNRYSPSNIKNPYVRDVLEVAGVMIMLGLPISYLAYQAHQARKQV